MRTRRGWVRVLGMAVAAVLLGIAAMNRANAVGAQHRFALQCAEFTARPDAHPPQEGDACVAPTALTAPARAPWILWNTSESLPRGLYLRTNDTIEVGAIVAACLPEKVAVIAKERGYLLPGSRCAGGVAPLLKRVAAVHGARVEVVDQALVIDGSPWPGGWVKNEDSRGRPVPWQTALPYVVAEGQVLLLGEHPGSFDGRYFGPVAVSALLGVYRAVP